MKYLLLVLGLASCLNSESKAPDLASYKEDTKMMLDICNKFAEEQDAKELHKTAVATQYVRLITRSDYNNETNLYFDYIKKAIRYSSDGSISAEERVDLRNHCEKLRSAVQEGRAKLENL